MKAPIAFALAAFLPVVSAALRAQEPAPSASKPQPAADPRATQSRDLLARYDANGNGKLDPDEIEVVARDRFLKWDADGSGKVDQAEMKKLREETVRGPKQDKTTRAANLARALEDARIQAESEKRARAKDGGTKTEGVRN